MAAVVRYLEVLDQLSAAPGVDMIALNKVASGDALAQRQYNLAQYQANGWHQVGRQTRSFTGSKPGSDATEWSIIMCIDVSGLGIVDADGLLVKNPTGVPRLMRHHSRGARCSCAAAAGPAERR